MVYVDYDQIHDVVSKNRNAMWDGWKAVFYRPNHNAYTQPNGRFINGRWCTVICESEPNAKGLWKVPVSYV